MLQVIVEVKGQLIGVGFSLGLNSGFPAWPQTPLPAEPLCWPLAVLFLTKLPIRGSPIGAASV